MSFRSWCKFFDAAEDYGDAEKILGKTVKSFREEVIIATKVGIRGGYKPNLSRKYLLKAHFNDPNTPVREVIKTLEELVGMGKIRYYGVCHLPYEIIEEYCECEVGNPFSVLAEFSVVNKESYKNLFPFT